MDEKRTKFMMFGLLGASFILFLGVQSCSLSLFKDKQIEKNEEQIHEESDDDSVKQETISQENQDIKPIERLEVDQIKSTVWNYVSSGDYEEAAKQMVKAYKSYEFTEENELDKWHLDVNLLMALEGLDSNQRAELLTSFKSARFQAIFPAFASPLVLSNIISDSDSVIPVDVKSFNLISEEYIEKSDFEKFNLTQHIEDMKIHAQRLYRALIQFNDSEIVECYISIMKDETPLLLGYYSNQEDSSYKTDKYWEDNRALFSSVPILNQ